MPRHLGSLGTSDGTIGTIGMLTGTRAARPTRAERARGRPPGVRDPRRASRSPGEVADAQTPDDADEDLRIKLGAVAAMSQIFKNMPKLQAERKAG